MPQIFNLGGQIQTWESLVPNYYVASNRLDAVGSSEKTKIVVPAMVTDIGGIPYKIEQEVTIDLNTANEWGNTAFQTAENRKGKDLYVYVTPDTNTSYLAKVVLSDNSTVPTGYTENNSRKIGGFHCLCADAGTLQTGTSHPYHGYLAGDVLFTSVWDQAYHRPVANPEGMVYCKGIQAWVDIYLASHSSAPTDDVPSDAIQSVYGGSWTVNRNQIDFNDDFGLAGKRLLTHDEFSKIAYGTGEEDDISGGSKKPTGGHNLQNGTRMLSHCGVEDAAGHGFQWLSDSADYVDSTTNYTAIAAPGWNGWSTRGSWYNRNESSMYGLIAGGAWGTSADSGSLCRNSAFLRSGVFSSLGGRGVSISKMGRF